MIEKTALLTVYIHETFSCCFTGSLVSQTYKLLSIFIKLVTYSFLIFCMSQCTNIPLCSQRVSSVIHFIWKSSSVGFFVNRENYLFVILYDQSAPSNKIQNSNNSEWFAITAFLKRCHVLNFHQLYLILHRFTFHNIKINAKERYFWTAGQVGFKYPLLFRSI